MLTYNAAKDLSVKYWACQSSQDKCDLIAAELERGSVDTSFLAIECKSDGDADKVCFEYFNDNGLVNIRHEFYLDKMATTMQSLFATLESGFLRKYIDCLAGKKVFESALAVIEDKMSLLPYKELFEKHERLMAEVESTNNLIYEDFITRYGLDGSRASLSVDFIARRLMRACKDYYSDQGDSHGDNAG